jgi:hypothetical protein
LEIDRSSNGYLVVKDCNMLDYRAIQEIGLLSSFFFFL